MPKHVSVTILMLLLAVAVASVLVRILIAEPKLGAQVNKISAQLF